jgi:hypothetical protein
VVVALLVPVTWAPPGIPIETWRAALAEDVVDLLVPLAEVNPAIAVASADRSLAAAISWPSMPVYELSEPSPRAALAAAAAAGADQAAVICADAPDLPALLIGKLLRPLSSRPVAVAPAIGGGLLGLAAGLPVPAWLPELDADRTAPADIAAAAPRAGLVGQAPAWHRMRGPDDLRRLDPALEGWAATRDLLSAHR